MSRQSILTKYIGPTNSRGSRVKAVQSGWHSDKRTNSITLHWDDALNSDQNHAKAAKALADRLGWNGRYTCGSLGAQSDFAYVFVIDDETAFEVQL
jgi:hypothetical protein